jgi:hypothetical protein
MLRISAFARDFDAVRSAALVARDETRLDSASWSESSESSRHTALPTKQIASHCAR